LLADGALFQGTAGELFIQTAVIGALVARNGTGIRRRHSQQLAAEGQLLFAVPIAEKAIVSNALETIWEDMK
jgi:hypothetical protein